LRGRTVSALFYLSLMIEPISTAAALALAKLAFDEFVKSGAGELGKKLTDSAEKSLMALGRAVWQRIRGKARPTAALAGAEKGDEKAQQQLKKFLKSEWQSDLEFAEEVRKLADDLHFELTQIEDNSSMTQNNYGGTNYQNKISGGTVNQANTINIGKNEA